MSFDIFYAKLPQYLKIAGVKKNDQVELASLGKEKIKE